MIHRLFPDDDWEPNEESRNKIRKIHHIRSQRFVEETLNIDIESHVRTSVGVIAKGHREVNLRAEEYTNPIGEVENLDLLSASLRLADELDFAYGRIEFLDLFLRPSVFLSKMQSESIAYWKSHMVLKDWKIDWEERCLIVSGTVCDLDGHLAIDYMKKKILSTLDSIRGVRFRGEHMFPYAADFQIAFSGYVGSEYHVETDNDIVDILIGSVYKDKIEGVRECIQNGIDACNVRKSIQKDYSPEVSVSLSDNSIVIVDNGCGMDKYIIENYLRIIGRSYYQSDEFSIIQSNLGESIPVIGMYGVGVFSLLLLTDNIIIQTCDIEAAKWYEVRITQSFAPIYEIDKPSIDMTAGTLVSLKLVNNDAESIGENLLTFLRYAFPRPPVQLKANVNGKSTAIGLFPVLDDQYGISKPLIEYDDASFLLACTNEDGVFFGISSDHMLMKYKSDKTLVGDEEDAKDWSDSIAVSIGGCRITDVEVDTKLHFALRILTQVMEHLCEVEYLYAYMDFPVGRIVPTLSKSDIIDGENLVAKTSMQFIDIIKNSLMVLKETYYNKGLINEFWDILIGGNYLPELIADFDMGEIVSSVEIWHSKAKVRVRDISSSEDKLLNMEKILTFFDTSHDADPSNGWIPLGHYEFVLAHLIRELRNRGWKLVFPIVRTNFADYEWDYISSVFEVLNNSEREQAAISILYSLDSAPDDFIIQIATEAYENKWSQLIRILMDPEYHFFQLYRLRGYIVQKNGDDFDELERSAGTNLRVNEYIHWLVEFQYYDRALEVVREIANEELDIDVAHSLWYSLNNRGFMFLLSQKYPSEFVAIGDLLKEKDSTYVEDLLKEHGLS